MQELQPISEGRTAADAAASAANLLSDTANTPGIGFRDLYADMHRGNNAVQLFPTYELSEKCFIPVPDKPDKPDKPTHPTHPQPPVKPDGPKPPVRCPDSTIKCPKDQNNPRTDDLPTPNIVGSTPEISFENLERVMQILRGIDFEDLVSPETKHRGEFPGADRALEDEMQPQRGD